MDIRQLLNPPSRSAVQGGVTETPRSQNVDSVAAVSVDSSFRNRLKARPASSACSPVGQYSHAINPNLNIETSGTARSSISSYSSMQSYPTIATSPSSTTTMNSNLSFSPGYIPGSNSYAPVFKVPNYSPTLTSPMSGPPTGEPLTPLGSDCSPSRVMSSYFPLQPPFQRRISGSAFENSDSLTALAALATEDSVVVRNEDDDVVDAAEVLTGRRSSRNSLTLGAPMAKKLRAADMESMSKFRSMSNVAEHPLGDRGYKGIAPHTESPNYSPTATAFVTPSPERSSSLRASKYDNSPPANRTIHSPDRLDESPPLDHDDFQDGDNMPKCSYIPNCSTSSPLRKVVSHIFGRNKLSTRQIPPNIWVYYCRKHYQRSRYRNPKGFAKLQCELVRKQVERLINWGGVSDWVIKVRRREEMRLSREGLIASQPEDDDESKGFPNKITKQNRANRKNWLVAMTGISKTHHDIRALLARIEEEVVHNGGTFPDVEILPNVLPSALDVLEEDQPRRRSDVPKAPSVREASEKLRPVKPIVPKSKKRKRSDDSDDATEQTYAHGGAGFNLSPVSVRPRGRSPSISTAHHADSAPRSVPEQSQQSQLSKRQSPLLSRNKRKASRSPSPAAEAKHGRMSHPEEQNVQHFGDTAARAKRPRTLKPMVRQQDAARNSELESVGERHYPHSAPLEASHESSFLPPPLMEDTRERQRRRSSTDTASLHSYMAMRGGMGSRLGSLSKPGMYSRAGRMQEHSPMFATPPPSASSFSGRSSAEPDDREFDASFKGFSFDRALGGDAPIDSSKHVRDYISAFTPKRSTRMQEIESFSAMSQNSNRKAGIYPPHSYSLKRKYGADEPEQQNYPPTSTPRHPAELPAGPTHRFNHQNSHSRVHVDPLQSASVPRAQLNSQSSSSRKRAVSLSPTKQVINPPMGTKRRRRASSVGPTRKKSSCASVAMKRTRTLPAKDFSSIHGMLDCIRVRN